MDIKDGGKQPDIPGQNQDYSQVITFYFNAHVTPVLSPYFEINHNIKHFEMYHGVVTKTLKYGQHIHHIEVYCA